MPKYTYSNWSDPKSKHWNGLPEGKVFECNAEDILIADKEFATKFGFKLTDKQGAHVMTRIELEKT